MPGVQSVLNPRIRCQRVSTSSMVVMSACPMWSAPVTFGGGIGSEYTGRASRRASLARNTPCSSQNAYQRGSTRVGSYALGISGSMCPPGSTFSLIGSETPDLFSDHRFRAQRHDFPDHLLEHL